MNKIVALVAAAIVVVLVLFSLPTLAEDCHGCGPSKSRFQ